ncbi:hypothetical protein B0H13DRAFT_1929236 [Mycena leptocephala]|nr:hypothetical protein B0H13DRAFT_1929236 [Mycena leptocephala]
MPRGRPPLDPETKAKRRQEALQRYADKYGYLSPQTNRDAASKKRDSLRASARLRMQSLRSRPATSVTGLPSEQVLRARALAARYRERHVHPSLFNDPISFFPSHREKIQAADTLHRAKTYIKKNGSEAFDEKLQRPHMAPHAVRRFDPKEVLTDNQKRCRGLRADGFEEDNGDDSDEDLPPGMCGCDRTDCQLTHKNETENRKEWKRFHLKYGRELEGGGGSFSSLFQ